MSIPEEYHFSSKNGKSSIYVREHRPSGTPRAVLQIAHGVSEHIRRYDPFAKFLADEGIAVAGNDHLGHGLSVSRGEVYGFFAETGGWEAAVGDLARLHDILREKYSGVPCFILGHSMGSFLTRSYLIDCPRRLDGVLLSGTGDQLPAVLTLGRLLSRLICVFRGADAEIKLIHDLSFGKYNDGFADIRTVSDWISSDQEAVDGYLNDELCGFTPKVGLFRDMLQGIGYISSPRNVSRMNKETPLYLFSGEMDPVGRNGAGVTNVYRLFLKAGCSDVTLRLYPQGRHEMLNEINRRDVYRDILKWIEDRMA